VWEDGAGGNYWSDDTAKYPNATEVGGSGVWATAYVIDVGNPDRYPLVLEVPPRTLLAPLMVVSVFVVMVHGTLKRRLS
jgi:hypothetical protein